MEVFDNKCDIFSYGLFANYLLTGQKHKGSGSNIQLDVLSPIFKDLITECLDLSSEERPTAHDLEVYLLKFDDIWEEKVNEALYQNCSKAVKHEVFLRIYGEFND